MKRIAIPILLMLGCAMAKAQTPEMPYAKIWVPGQPCPMCKVFVYYEVGNCSNPSKPVKLNYTAVPTPTQAAPFITPPLEYATTYCLWVQNALNGFQSPPSPAIDLSVGQQAGLTPPLAPGIPSAQVVMPVSTSAADQWERKLIALGGR